MRIARRAVPLVLAACSFACARQCGGLGGGPPAGVPTVKDADGKEYFLVDKGPYKAFYDHWGRLERIEYDKNGDGRPDHIAHYQGGRTARLLEVDEDGDGYVDRWEYYDGDAVLSKTGRARHGHRPDTWTYPGADGQPRRIEYDDDGDGVVERAELFENGRLVAVELDTSRDGTPAAEGLRHRLIDYRLPKSFHERKHVNFK
jgi:hypothetical protein